MQGDGSGKLNTHAEEPQQVLPEPLSCLLHQAVTRLELDRVHHSQQQGAAPCAPAPPQHCPAPGIERPGRMLHPARNDFRALHQGCNIAASPAYPYLPPAGNFLCDVVHEDPADDQELEESPFFTTPHLRIFIRLLQDTIDTTKNSWLASILSQAAYIPADNLHAWIEQALHDFVHQLTRGQVNVQEAFCHAWVVTITRCSAFSGEYSDLIGFTNWLHILLRHFPNLSACLV